MKQSIYKDDSYPFYEKDHVGEESWTIRLNSYQRNNLLWLLGICGHNNGVGVVEPFHFARTGDWLGEISNMLVRPLNNQLIPTHPNFRLNPSDEYIGPDDITNATIGDIEKDIEMWVDTKIVVDR